MIIILRDVDSHFQVCFPLMKNILLTTVSAFMLAAPMSMPAYATADLPIIVDDMPDVELNKTQQAFADALSKGSYQGLRVGDLKGLRDFYKSQTYNLIWSSRGKVGKYAGAAIDVLEDSWTHGMAPDTYNVRQLRQMAKAKLDQNALFDFEILMSDAVARYGHDITGMRVNAKTLGEDTKSWQQGLDTFQTLKYITSGSSISKSLENLAPSGRLYETLRSELKKLVNDIADNPNADPPILKYVRAIYPGERDAGIPAIRTRLRQSEKVKDINDIYDESLAQAVAKFQRSSGLKPDAIIGKRTYAALNQGRQDKLVKIIANMERQRWMGPHMPERYIVVNVPAMMLWAIDDGSIKYEMPVVVGREKRPTQSFVTNITGIRFNPSWNVPDTIKTEDYLPALQADPQALKKKGIELIRYTSDGYENIPPESIDWSTMTPQKIKALGMVQNPGDDNALGRIRVLMPNKYDIYLHDTNTPALFSKDFRALSSGCIRLAEPEKIANFILAPNQGWSTDKMNGYLEKTKTIEVKAQQSLPVYILYQTTWLDEAGDIVYGDDLYGNDIKLVSELKRSGQVQLPINLK
jgi:murein L,D-transpeptidase YcbB/YkuD